MTPIEILAELELLGIKITRRTLLNYEKWGLLPEPVRGALGRGKGNFTHYPEEAVWQAYAAWRMLNDKLNPYRVPAVLKARTLYLEENDNKALSSQDKHLQTEWFRYALWGKVGIPVNAVEIIVDVKTKPGEIEDSSFQELIESHLGDLTDQHPESEELYFIFHDKENESAWIYKWERTSHSVTKLMPQ